ncbi:MAG: zf-HC2 domain-containing protein, partial [Acidobacteria bacterium]|nr:zf-HC2 domain-containing protein [Acidobacteriota bacterium]
MNRCAEIVAWIEGGGGGKVPPRFASHAEQCEGCATALEQATGLGDGAARVRGLHAPAELIQRLKALPHVAPECERALGLIFAAMDGDIAAPDRSELLTHLHGCDSCRRVWEALATLREVGQRCVVDSRLRE